MLIVGEPKYYNNRTDTVTNPQVIVEVLSESTQCYDREENRAYRTIASFQEYLLVDQNSIHIDHFSQTGKKCWELREYDREDKALALTTVPFEISLLDLYNKVKFEPATAQYNSAVSDA